MRMTYLDNGQEVEWSTEVQGYIEVDVPALMADIPVGVIAASYKDGMAAETIDGDFVSFTELAQTYGLDISDYII